MTSYSKYTSVIIVLMAILGCGDILRVEEPKPFLSDEQKSLIRKFATQNGYPETVPIDSFVEYLYEDWPNESEIKDFLLTFPIQDTVPKTLVLTDVLTQIGKTLRVHHSDLVSGSIHPAYIDSIEIRTDSVIILPSLDLEDCHLTHLPPEIGKIRTRSLDISYNNSTLEYLPDELMQIDDVPHYWDELTVRYDMGAVRDMDTSRVSDSLKNWLEEHAASW